MNENKDCSHCKGYLYEVDEYEPTFEELMNCDPRPCKLCNGTNNDKFWDEYWEDYNIRYKL